MCGAGTVQSSQSFDFLLSALSAYIEPTVGAIVGGTLGGVVVIVLVCGGIAVVVVWLCWKKKR